MAADQELERHLGTWRSFTKLVQWTIVLVTVVVVILALITL
jgi:hypothetical protein